MGDNSFSPNAKFPKKKKKKKKKETGLQSVEPRFLVSFEVISKKKPSDRKTTTKLLKYEQASAVKLYSTFSFHLIIQSLNFKSFGGERGRSENYFFGGAISPLLPSGYVSVVFEKKNKENIPYCQYIVTSTVQKCDL